MAHKYAITLMLTIVGTQPNWISMSCTQTTQLSYSVRTPCHTYSLSKCTFTQGYWAMQTITGSGTMHVQYIHPMDMHTYTHSLSLSHTHTLVPTHTHTHSLSLSQTHTHRHTHTHTSTSTSTCTQYCVQVFFLGGSKGGISLPPPLKKALPPPEMGDDEWSTSSKSYISGDNNSELHIHVTTSLLYVVHKFIVPCTRNPVLGIFGNPNLPPLARTCRKMPA